GVRAGAAVLLGDVWRVEVRGAQGVVRGLRELRALVHLGGVRGDLVVAQLPYGLADGLVLLRQLVPVELAHRGLLPVGSSSGYVSSERRRRWHDTRPVSRGTRAAGRPSRERRPRARPGTRASGRGARRRPRQ